MDTEELRRELMGSYLEGVSEICRSACEIAAPLFPLSSGEFPIATVALLVAFFSAAWYAAHSKSGRLSESWSLPASEMSRAKSRQVALTALTASHTVISIYWMLTLMLLTVSLMAWLLLIAAAWVG